MMSLPWTVEARGDFEPYIHESEIFTTRVNIEPSVKIVPPWQVEERINPEEEFQKEEQGHGYHGWWESGKRPSAGGDGGDSSSDNQQQSAADATMAFLNANPGGFTISTKDGSSPTTGFQVGGVTAPLFVDPNSPDTAAAVEKYVNDNKALLDRSDMHLGGWLGDDGRYEIEVSQQIANPQVAAKAAADWNQNSYWDNAQAAQNDQVRSTGTTPDGKIYVPPAPGQKDTLPDPLHFSFGTGDFGVVNPMTKEGCQPITGPNGEVRIAPSIGGRQIADSAGLSQEWRDKAEDRMAEAQMPDQQTMADNSTALVERASARDFSNGIAFYPRANAEARDIAKTTNGIVTPYQAAGAIAALSPNTVIGSNMTGARFVCQAVATNMVMHFDPQWLKDYNSGISRPKDDGTPGNPFNIQNDTPIMEQPTRDDAAAAVLAYMKANGIKEDPKWGEPNIDGSMPGVGLNSGTSGIGKAIDIASGFRYEDPAEAATPENTLGAGGAMKERDFFNNIINPNDTQSVTIDGWEVGALKGTGEYNAKISDTEKKNSETYKVIMRAPVSGAEGYGGGCYALCVDAINASTDQINQDTGYSLNNIEVQSIGWHATRSESKGVTPSAGNNPVNALMAADLPAVSSTSIPMFPNAVEQRPLLSQKAAATALAKQYPGINFGGVTSIYGVKCNDGTVAFALPDFEMQDLMDHNGDLGATGHIAQGPMEKYGMSLPTKEDINTVLSTVADLHERDPLDWSDVGATNALTNGGFKSGKTPAEAHLPPLVTLRGPDNTTAETGFDPYGGLQGWTSPAEPNSICLNASVLSREHVNTDVGWHMPAGNTVSVQQYVATHEYGHLNEFATQNTPAGNRVPAEVKSAFSAANKFSATQSANSPNSLSEYGRQNAHEAYAEAYTEVSLTNGATDNAVAQIYDRVFNWTGTHADSQAVNVAALAVKSGLSPAKVEQQLKNHPELGSA